MIKVKRSKDCGNSPKNKFSENIAVAFVKKDSNFLSRSVSDGIKCFFSNGTHLQGKESLQNHIKKLESPIEAKIDHVLTHGKKGAVSGSLKYKDDSRKRFCLILEFSNVKAELLSHLEIYLVKEK